MRSVTGMFYVKDFDHDHPEDEKLVPAKFLLGLDGQPVKNPNSTSSWNPRSFERAVACAQRRNIIVPLGA